MGMEAVATAMDFGLLRLKFLELNLCFVLCSLLGRRGAIWAITPRLSTRRYWAPRSNDKDQGFSLEAASLEGGQRADFTPATAYTVVIVSRHAPGQDGGEHSGHGHVAALLFGSVQRNCHGQHQ